ncbi:hypothetical protein ACQTH0_25955, partial [Klebsiella pneumoniae]|uniref:hypothetical protein n=1 Tax=Klebsiella pneumoniae TaxID=573 RepID=UPI003D1627B0
ADRQIIMVTHNANLVVGTDAECVIVSNQSGQRSGIENSEFRFEYYTGSLECSFTSQDDSGRLHTRGIREHVCEILEGLASSQHRLADPDIPERIVDTKYGGRYP